MDLQSEEVQYLKVACDKLRNPLVQLLHLDLLDMILFDFVISWIPKVAKKLGVRGAFFSAYTASMLVCLLEGMVSLGWAPQVKILAHPVVGGCLHHLVWNSIIETLGFGHPQIPMPMVDDQGLNAKLLVKKGLALELCRNKDGSFTRDEVVKSIRLALVEEKGEQRLSQAEQGQGIFADQDVHNNYVSEFIEFINLDLNESSHD